MKALQAALSSSLLLLMSTASYAEFQFPNFSTPYVGVDYGYAHIGFKNNFGDPVFAESLSIANGYFGFFLCPRIGVEVGYESTESKHDVGRLTAGNTSIPGGSVLLAAGEFNTLATSYQVLQPHASLFYNYPLNGYFDLYGSLGVAMSTLHASYTILGDDDSPYTSVQRRNSTANFSKTTGIPLARLAVKFHFNDYLGMRLIGSWENTSRLQVTSSHVSLTNTIGNNELKPKDTYSLMLGLFVQFV